MTDVTLAPQTVAKVYAIEGPDGSGKTTIIQALAERYRRCGFRVLCLREPGGSIVSEKIRDIVKHNNDTEEPLCKETELLLFLAARVQLIKHIIIPMLTKVDIILLDRYELSTFVYQGLLDELAQIEPWALDTSPGRVKFYEFISKCRSFYPTNTPKVTTCYLRISVETAIRRLGIRNDTADRFDTMTKEKRTELHRAYERISTLDINVWSVEASLAISDVVDKCFHIFKSFDPLRELP